MRGKIRSYYVVLKAETGLLLGGVHRTRSSRFSTASAAMAWRDQAVAANTGAGREVSGIVLPSRLEAEVEGGDG